MSQINLTNTASTDVVTPAASSAALFINSADAHLSMKNPDGTVTQVGGGIPSGAGYLAGSLFATDGATTPYWSTAVVDPSNGNLTLNGSAPTLYLGGATKYLQGGSNIDLHNTTGGIMVSTSTFLNINGDSVSLYSSGTFGTTINAESGHVEVGIRRSVWGVNTAGSIQLSNIYQGCGTATLSGGTATVSCSIVDANTVVQLTIQDPNGATPGVLYISSKTVGTGFVITSTNSSDTCKVFWNVITVGTF